VVTISDASPRVKQEVRGTGYRWKIRCGVWLWKALMSFAKQDSQALTPIPWESGSVSSQQVRGFSLEQCDVGCGLFSAREQWETSQALWG